MQRSYGRNWNYPGFPSLAINYWDSNDFFYSGHLGTIAIWTSLYYAEGYRCMFIFCICLAIFMCLVMISVRIHYTIDLITGYIVGHWCIMQADWVCYFLDVKILGLSRKKRRAYVTRACNKCGWNNWKVKQCMGE